MLDVVLDRGRLALPRDDFFREKPVRLVEIFQLAESLGGVESLIGYPPGMTHASVRGTALAVPENVVRLSVGIEGVDDLIADLEQGLARG